MSEVDPEKVLIDRGLVTPEQLRQAEMTAMGGASVFDTLLGDGILTAEQLGWHLADAHELPYVRLSPQMADHRLAMQAGERFLTERRAVPLTPLDGDITVAIADVRRAGTAEEFRTAFGTDQAVYLAIAPDEDVRRALEGIFGAPSAELPAASAASPEAPAAADAIDVFHDHLARASRRHVSLVRFDPTPTGLVVRTRLCGETRTVDRRDAADALIVAASARAALGGRQSGDAEVQIDGRDVTIRVEIVPTVRGDAVLVALAPPALAGLDPKAVDGAVAALLEGPVLLATAHDAGLRRELVHCIVGAAGSAADPVVVVGDECAIEDMPVLAVPATSIEDAAALEPRILVVSARDIDDEQVRALARTVPGILLVRCEATAAASLALCGDAVRPLVRAAIGPGGLREERPWT